MQKVTFLNEHLLIGNIGHAFVVLAFVAALLSGILYFFHEKRPDSNFKKLSRILFYIHAISVIGIFVTLFTIIHSHYFEYQYAWQHSSKSLPIYYMISCFWEGQEGSFLLWAFWHAIIGLILIRKSKEWEAPIMVFLCLSQVVLCSMVLGISIADIYTIGSSPFALLREKMAASAPIFKKPDYLASITDGRGLNPLLQNYWMVIHPPTLFLGFASTIVPFAFAMAGLWKRKYTEWINPALPYTIFSVMVLGLGIIMGGFWAYESLSFGGYWAWDPVENASLVPWITLIAALHVMIIFKSTKTGLIWVFILCITSFFLILYATFLTRSGILGNTSVHSFTDLGLSGQLLLFMFLFFALPLLIALPSGKFKRIVHISYWGLLLINIIIGIAYPNENLILVLKWVDIVFFTALAIYSFVVLYQILPKNEQEYIISARELWMFVGSLVLILSAFQIILTTSSPVINKLFGTKISPPLDVISHYNNYQLPLTIIISILMAFSQYLKYKKTNTQKFIKDFLKIVISSLILTVLLAILFQTQNIAYLFLLFSAVFVIVGNIAYAIQVLKFKLKNAGGSITHIGFGMMIIGILVSSTNKKIISSTPSQNAFSDNKKTNAENILLFKGDTLRMSDYLVTYSGDSIDGPNHYYKVDYKGIGNHENFRLLPNAQIQDNNLMANPDTRHYLTHDVYTHVTNVPNKEKQENEAWGEPKEYEINKGDTIRLENGILIFESIDENVKNEKARISHKMFGANIKILVGKQVYYAKPIFAISDKEYYTIEDVNDEIGIKLNFYIKITDKVRAFLETSQRTPNRDFIIMKAIVFPYINLLWGGVIIMIIGMFIAMKHRLKRA